MTSATALKFPVAPGSLELAESVYTFTSQIANGQGKEIPRWFLATIFVISGSPRPSQSPSGGQSRPSV